MLLRINFTWIRWDFMLNGVYSFNISAFHLFKTFQLTYLFHKLPKLQETLGEVASQSWKLPETPKSVQSPTFRWRFDVPFDFCGPVRVAERVAGPSNRLKITFFSILKIKNLSNMFFTCFFYLIYETSRKN
jgi:hypothetical protein